MAIIAVVMKTISAVKKMIIKSKDVVVLKIKTKESFYA